MGILIFKKVSKTILFAFEKCKVADQLGSMGLAHAGVGNVRGGGRGCVNRGSSIRGGESQVGGSRGGLSREGGSRGSGGMVFVVLVFEVVVFEEAVEPVVELLRHDTVIPLFGRDTVILFFNKLFN